jgi:SOS response associated peptidase (SRAP)
MPMLVAMRSVDGRRIPQMMKWGLIPHWAKDSKLQYSTFNARSEEFTTKPTFKDAWKWGQRCLMVTNGFYEWKKLDAKGKLKQAYAVDMASGSWRKSTIACRSSWPKAIGRNGLAKNRLANRNCSRCLSHAPMSGRRSGLSTTKSAMSATQVRI